MKRGARLKQDVPGRWIGGRYVRRRRNLLPILIEESATDEPVVVEPAPGKPASRPAGFWRGAEFHRVVRLFGCRFERDAMYVRVLSERGRVYELRRSLDTDPWTWRSRWRWDLIAVIRIVSVRRLPSDPRQWIWPEGVRSR